MKFAGHTTSTWLKFGARMGQGGVRRTKRTMKRTFRVRRVPRIVPYRGFGNGSVAVVSGRVLESRPIREPRARDRWFTNFRHTWRHLTCDVVAACPLVASYRGVTRAGASDEKGYFHFRFDSLPPQERPAAGAPEWSPVELARRTAEGEPVTRAFGQILIPPADCSFGIISDMDDTVIRSNVSDVLKLARLTLFKNARTRKPFEGVAAFYRALHAGPDGRRANPLFYVSSSAWGLYDQFRVFLEHNHLPSGPLLLRETTFQEKRFVVDPGHGHKLHRIGTILEIYPRMRFILVGDSGQDDPFIYQEAVESYPGRIQGIYIRDVRSARRERVRQIARDLSAGGVPTMLVATSLEAAEDAAARGWIEPTSLPEVQSDLRADLSLEGR